MKKLLLAAAILTSGCSSTKCAQLEGKIQMCTTTTTHLDGSKTFVSYVDIDGIIVQ